MNIPHPLGVLAPSQEALEAVDPRFIKEGIYHARDKTKLALQKIHAAITIGMTEEEGRKLALEICATMGATKHWHTPHVRFGAGTLLNFNDKRRSDRQLELGNACYIDLGPVWTDPAHELSYEGDYGDSFVFGENPDAELCVSACHQLFQEAQNEWRKNER
jgi:hypothetical protein